MEFWLNCFPEISRWEAHGNATGRAGALNISARFGLLACAVRGGEAKEMSMRLQDQPAVLEWFPTEMKTVRRYQPVEMTRQRMSFETVAAAVSFATSSLPEAFRLNATIETRGGITLHWADIEAMSKTAGHPA